MNRRNTRSHAAVLVGVLSVVGVSLPVAAEDRVQSTNALVLTTQAPAPPYPANPGPGVMLWAPAFTSGIMKPRDQVTGAAAARNGMVQLNGRQDSVVAARAGQNVNLYLTANLLGNITKNAGGVTSFSFQTQLFDTAGGGALATIAPAAFTAAGAVNQFTVVPVPNQPGSTYRVVTTTTTNVMTAAGTAGLINDVDFNTVMNAGTVNEQNFGVRGQLIASPRNLPNSRNAIGVAAARANDKLKIGGQGATGNGINLGQIELGRPYTTHVDLPNAALGVDAQANNAFWASEHALAVAGIMVGRSGSSARAGVAPGAKLWSSSFLAYPGTSQQQILGSMHWMVDVGTTADVLNTSFSIPDLTNTDANDGDNQTARLYDWVVARKRKIFVTTAGNGGGNGAPDPGEDGFQNGQVQSLANSISGNNGGYNVITVGALDWDFKSRRYSSSFGPTDHPVGQPRAKPDIMAPGTFILSPMAVDLDGASGLDDYERVFFGIDDFRRPANSRIAGAAISGTSFAAPHVAGAVGMYLEFARSRDGSNTGDRTDPRVVKAAVMNTGDRTVKHRDGMAWGQAINLGGAVPTITSPLDNELGAGMLKIDRAMLQVHPAEARAGNNVNDVNQIVAIKGAPLQWDLQDIGSSANASNRVSYRIDRGLVHGQKVRATAVWHSNVTSTDGNNTVETTDTFTRTALSNLDLALWRRLPENDPDKMVVGQKFGTHYYEELLRSASQFDNVELIDTSVGRNGVHYLDILNKTAQTDRFAIAWDIGSNPAAAGSLSPLPTATDVPGGVTSLLNDPLDIENTSGISIRASFHQRDLADDHIYVLDDNEGFSYDNGQQYNIYFGPELRDDPFDQNSDTDWFNSGSISLNSLLAQDWLSVLSSPADADGNLFPTRIDDQCSLDRCFLSLVNEQIATFGAAEFNFAVDVDNDGFFTPDIDGVGWFEVIVPEPSTLSLLGANGFVLLMLCRRRSGLVSEKTGRCRRLETRPGSVRSSAGGPPRAR